LSSKQDRRPEHLKASRDIKLAQGAGLKAQDLNKFEISNLKFEIFYHVPCALRLPDYGKVKEGKPNRSYKLKIN
jgi:hypothetical protein